MCIRDRCRTQQGVPTKKGLHPMRIRAPVGQQSACVVAPLPETAGEQCGEQRGNGTGAVEEPQP
eukprot:11694164-Prorocentrum_lima.AAC.1